MPSINVIFSLLKNLTTEKTTKSSKGSEPRIESAACYRQNNTTTGSFVLPLGRHVVHIEQKSTDGHRG
tara:strand:- start:62972 stop:63175 length:204 start_codon:yes stop_codon:yes gene_type:complete